MVRLTKSLSMFLLTYYKDIYVPITFGHTELLTEDIYKEYLEWCTTDEGKQYLEQ